MSLTMKRRFDAPHLSAWMITGAVVATLLVTACSSAAKHTPTTVGPSGGSTAVSSGAVQPKSGGTLAIGEYSAVVSLDPVKATGAGTAGGIELDAVYDTLMRYDPTSGTYQPELAQSLTPNADSTVWTLKLRPNVTFTDGTPLDAQAVVQNLQRDRQTVTNTGAAELSLIASVTAPDPQTVVITLSSPWTDFSYALADKSGNIAAPSYLAKVASGDTGALPVGAGPFKVTTFRPSEEIDMVRNPNYWAGPPYLDGVKFTFIPGGSATYQSFQTGQLQMAVLNDAVTEKAAAAAHVPNYKAPVDAGGLFLLNNAPRSNGKGSVFGDVRLRRAAAEALDPQVMNERLYQGDAQATNLLFPPGSRWYYTGEQGIAYNPNDAKALVAQVKQETGWDGTIRVVCNNSTNTLNFGPAVESLLDPVGFKVQVINNLDLTGEITQVLIKQDFDAACWAWNASDADPYAALHQNLGTGSVGDRISYTSPDMDAALTAFRAASTPQAKGAAIRQIVGVWNATVPSVNFADVGTMDIYSSHVQGAQFTLNGAVLVGKAWLGG